MAINLQWDNVRSRTGISTWGENPYKWDDVFLILEVGAATGDEIAYNVNQLDPEKKKRFIKLICKVKGIETYSGQKTIRDDIKVTAEDGSEVKDVDGSEINFKLDNLSKDMTNADDISNAEIRHRAEQYVVVITESIRDVNRELQDQKANKRRLQFRETNIKNLKNACLGNFKNRKDSVNTNYD